MHDQSASDLKLQKFWTFQGTVWHRCCCGIRGHRHSGDGSGTRNGVWRGRIHHLRCTCKHSDPVKPRRFGQHLPGEKIDAAARTVDSAPISHTLKSHSWLTHMVLSCHIWTQQTPWQCLLFESSCCPCNQWTRKIMKSLNKTNKRQESVLPVKINDVTESEKKCASNACVLPLNP